MQNNKYTTLFRHSLKLKDVANLKLFAAILILAIMILVTKWIFEDRGWTIAIAIANIFFLIIIRAIPYESLIGITDLDRQWRKRKIRPIKVIISKSVSEQLSDNDIVIKTTPGMIVPPIEPHAKLFFLRTDSRTFITSYKSELVTIIAVNIFLILISLFSTPDTNGLFVPSSKLTPEAIKMINNYKQQLEVSAAVAIVCLQAVLLVKVPLLIDTRNKAYLAEQKQAI